MLIQIYMIILKLRSSEASSASNINLKCQFSRWKKMPLEEETHPILEFVSKQSTFDLVTWSVHRINQIYEYNLVWVMDIWRLKQSYFVQLFNVTQGLPWKPSDSQTTDVHDNIFLKPPLRFWPSNTRHADGTILVSVC